MADWLAQREKKRQEGTLRQAPGGSYPATSSTVRPPPKKKSVSRPTEKTLDLSPSPSFPSSPSTSAEVVADQGSSGSPFVGDNLDQELKLTVPFIDLESKEEEEEPEDMTQNLRTPREEPAPKIPTGQVLPSKVVRPYLELVVRPLLEDTCPAENEVPTATPDGTSNMEEFFPFSHHHFINLGNIPRMVGVVRPSHVAPDSALRCTYLLLKYTAEEMVEVDANEELHTQLGRVESELVAVRIVVVDVEKAMRELDQLKNELEDLQATSEVQKKRLEELRVGFTTEKEAMTKYY
ncbi:hypothetical protein CK203_076152 [Vitis vinifera]|uniref:Uncharacterized protein n=1 Tax=Vitis vinifera TaxID=29760 RepID=A0A438EE76_VITVI|nr:hypothetical protein CK203_076152 [Vitis vinifera]